MQFYDDIAEDYDDMMDFERRLGTAVSFARAVVDRYGVAAACDVACGTGLYALALARAGIERVSGADLSAKMLAAARRHGEQLDLDVEWFHCGMQDSRECLAGPYDLLLCLGNSLPHVLTEPELRAVLSGFHSQLKPGGHVIVQVLNYDRILRQQVRIVDVTRSPRADAEFVRFYDFLERTVRFNLLTIHWNGNQAEHRMQSTELYPYRSDELQRAFAQHGFTNLQLYGGLDFSTYQPAESASLMLVAQRTGCDRTAGEPDRNH